MPTTLIEGRLYCLSRSAEPIKRLIAEASALYHKKSASKTTIRRPAPRQQRNDGNPWRTVARRPSRPLETVVLESKEKTRLISDIADYLKPNSRKWYAERGIPYRRGYVNLASHLFMNKTDFFQAFIWPTRHGENFSVLCRCGIFWPRCLLRLSRRTNDL